MQTWSTGLRHYIWIIQHWLWLILLGTILTTGVTYVFNTHLAPVYEASTLIQVNGTGNPNNNDVFSRQAMALAYSLLINDTDVLQQVAQKMPGVSVNQLQRAVSDSPLVNSEIIEVRAQSDNAQQAADIANAVATTFIQIENTRTSARLKDIEKRIAQNLAMTKQLINADELQLTHLQQSHASQDQIIQEQDALNTDQENYNSSLKSYNEVQLEELQANSILSIAQTALPPDKPTSPQVMLNTIIAALLSLLVILVLVLLLDWVDATIQTPEDVTNLAMLESIGSVPLSKHPLLLDEAPKQGAAKDAAVEEAFTILSASFDILSKGRKVLMVTSLRSGAGTSTTAVNLAISLAWTGKRVLLIDANLRRPVLHEIFQYPNMKGLISGLSDVTRLHKDVVLLWLNQWSTTISNLWLLPAGPPSNDPAKLMRSPELCQLVGWLLGQHQSIHDGRIADVVDFIIFDTPALEVSADAVALSTVTDNTILVVEAGKERKEALDNAALLLQRLSSPVLGVIVNRQTAKHRPYFYVDRHHQDVMTTESSPQQTFLPNTSLPASKGTNAQQNGSTISTTQFQKRRI